LSRKRDDVQVLYLPGKGELLDSPVWSPDGGRIAFLVGRDVAVMDVQTKTILRRISTRAGSAAAPAEVRHGFLRWSQDGKQVFIGGGGTGVWNVVSDEIRWTSDYAGMDFIYGEYRGRSHRNPDGSYHASYEKLPDSPFVAPLFGSIDHPVVEPVWSQAGRYYFYRRAREGFGARGWIEGYDVVKKRTFTVRTLWWAPYVE
jgi:hypothetical protein